MSLRTSCRRALAPSNRSVTMHGRRLLSDKPKRGDVSEQLRAVMRNVPQPVAIAVTRKQNGEWHGATLSSFTSLTLHPYPLVAFSLRLPSRLADSLRPVTTSTQEEPHIIPDPLASERIGGQVLGISLLGRSHEDLAVTLSQPGHDHSSVISSPPFTLPNPSSDPTPAIVGPPITDLQALPILDNAVGTLKCQVVSSLPLRDVCDPANEDSIEFDDEVEGAGLYTTDGKQADNGADNGEVHGSELFICRVLEVQPGHGADPILYYKNKYTGVKGE